MHRLIARLLFLLLSAVLLAGLCLPTARADGPALTAKLGLGGRYRTERWCRVMVGVTNPGPDTISGQVQVLTVATENRQGRFGRGGMHAPVSPAVFACPVSVPAGTTQPRLFPVYVRGIDPGQGDLTVQLVEGRERGEGRVLAKISSQDPNQAAAFSGSPIGGNDRLLIGFGGDPGAFLFLNGRQMPTQTQNSRNAPYFGNQNTGMAPTVQVVALSAADLPDRAAGYAGVYAFLLRSDAPVEALTEAQSAALRSWVAGGGHLIVCGGPDATRFGSPFFEGLLPATLTTSGLTEGLVLAPKPLPGVHVLLAKGEPLAVAGPYGAGTVTVTAVDPKMPSSQTDPAGLPAVWKTLLAARSAPSALRLTAWREENTGQYYYGGSGGPRLSETVIRGPSLDAPGTLVIAVFLLVYLVILVPVNYLVLKRMDRKEWAWLTIPALVLLFAAGTFGVGYAAKGGSVFVNRAALIETSAGHSEAGVYSEVGLFSPHRSSYDIDLPGNNLVAALPNASLNYGSQGGDTQGAGGVQFIQTPAGVSLVNTPVNMWAMRAFDTQSTLDLGGTIDGKLSASGNTLTGTLVNHTAYALSDCAVLYQGQWRSVSSLAPGATLTVLGSEPISGELPLLPHTDDAHTDIHERMQAALGSYFRSLAQTDATVNGDGTAQAAFAPSPSNALLVGWSRDPKLAGPSPKIDGRTVTENDVSLVIIHVPVVVALVPTATVPHPAQGPLPTRQFATVTKSSVLYRKALTASALGAGPASQITGKTLHILGIVTGIEHNSSTASGAILLLTQGSVPVMLPFSTDPNDRDVRALLSQEVLVTGALTRPKVVTAYTKEFIVSQPSQLQIVH